MLRLPPVTHSIDQSGVNLQLLSTRELIASIVLMRLDDIVNRPV